ncbi:putative odorant receptor 85d [Diachasma alloeum]|uniref:Odorant receptor n=1 Tax=Diachasma alloeum TaxID=454923 RepID=A0A4E0RMV8_9HYME|nr:putative odorant receptor 85d [Diachasma alloeum]THK33108.1 odorant receptor 38 [Diachasma alloeum]
MDLRKETPIPWNDDTKYALGLYRQYLTLLGIWPLERDRVLPTLRLMLFIVIQMSVNITYITNLMTTGYCGRILDLVEIITILSLSNISVFKLIVPWGYSDKMYFVLNSMVEDWVKVYDRKSHDTMMKYAYKGRAVCVFQLFITAFLIIRNILHKLPATVETITPENVTTLSRIVPYGPACWVSTTMSAHYYNAYYSLICIHWLSAALAYIGTDIYLFGLGMHMCGQFELLAAELDDISGNENCEEQHEKISKFIRRHNHLLNVAESIEDVYNIPILVEVINNTVIISISGIILLWAFKLRSRAMAIPKLIRIYLFYVEIFMVSYVGQALSEKTEKLQEAVYNIPWYKIPKRHMKALVIVMMRVKYPFQLTAGKIAHMNYETYKNIIKSTFSYFSVFRLVLEQ